MTRLAHAPTSGLALTAEGPSASLLRLAAEISDALRLPQASQPDRIQGALRRAVAAPDLLCGCPLECDLSRYARHVAYADPAGRFTVLALVWGPGQASSAHAHRVWCAYGVREGSLQETLFAFDTGARNAIALGRHDRDIGYAAFAPGGSERGHRLANTGNGIAVSIHVYGVADTDIATGVNEWMEFA